jgi:hypothetical protein
MKISQLFLSIITTSYLLAGSVFAADVQGSSSAVFINPQPSFADVSGTGTNFFSFGSAVDSVGPSTLGFSSAAFSTNFGTPFKLGTLTFFNGTIAGNSGADSVDLSTTLNFTAPSIPSTTSDFSLILNNTTNTSDPDASADFVYFSGVGSVNSFLIDGIAYNVKISGFQNVIGDGFLTSDSTQFRVREASSATADLFGVVSIANNVPEPGSLALIGLGLAGFAGARLKKRQK